MKQKNKYKMVAIIGQSGSGKDTILKRILKENSKVNEVISFTTRPPREGEKEGINYYFISKEEYAEKLLNNQFLEASCFNDWFYATGYDSLDRDKVNVAVLNPEGIDSIKARNDIDLYVFYIEATDKQRLLRQLNREREPDIEEIFRRYKTDKSDFCDLDFHYNALDNNTIQDLEHCILVINSAIKRLAAEIK